MDPFVSKKLSVLRFLAVASVVVYHAYQFAPGHITVAPPAPDTAAHWIEGYVSLALMRWALPFLGLVSGYLFFRTLEPTFAGFAAKWRSRARSLLVPFLIWSGVGVLFALAVTHSPLAGLSDYWTIDSLGEALDRWLLHPVIYPLWFLQALMACVVLSPLVYLLIRLLRGWVLVLAVAWWVLGWQPAELTPWISATAFPTFIAGATIALRGWRSPWRPGQTPAWAAATLVAVWLAAAAAFATYGHALGRWERAGLLPVVVLGIASLWCVGDALRTPLRAAPRLTAAAVYVAPLSFFVYVTQEPPLAVFKLVAERATASLPSAGSSLLATLAAYLAPPLCVILLSVGVALAFRRVAPRLYAVTAGGRLPGRRSLAPTPPPQPELQPEPQPER